MSLSTVKSSQVSKIISVCINASCLLLLLYSPVQVVNAQSCSANGTPPTINVNCTSGFVWGSGDLTNNATINPTDAPSIINSASTGSFINNGTLSGSNLQPLKLQFDTVSMTNNNIIQPPSGAGSAIFISGATLGTLTNNSSGLINNLQADQSAIAIYEGAIVTLNNHGTISAIGDARGIEIIFSSIDTLNNYGTINIGGTGIYNDGFLGVLNNAQGSAGALTYVGNLPQNYGIILGSNASTYGKLSASDASAWDRASGPGTGTTTFGINSGTVKSTKYTAVISGVTASLLTTSSLTGTYSSGGKSYAYSLALEFGSSTIWDLLFPTYVSGPTTADTQLSLVNTATSLQGTYTLQNSVLANSFSYDCNVFGANNVCVSAGGRNTQVQAANGLNNTSALLIAAYRPHPNYRIGAYADQNLSVNNAGSTVNLGNNTPLIGLFGAWNERLDGMGAEVKVSAAYGQKNTTVTRQVVGTSEAGSGSSQLNS